MAKSTKAQDELASNLNELCQGAVRAAAAHPKDCEAFLGHVIGQAHELRAAGPDGASIADFLDALAEILSGRNLEAALAGLVEPFRQGLRAVSLDLEAAMQRKGAAQAGDENDTENDAIQRPSTSSSDAAADVDPSDWVAALAAQTVTLLKDRDRDAASALVAELGKIRSRPGVDPDASAYMGLLEEVLSGKDVRAQALRLAQPYRDAYFSMQKLMMGSDPRKALLKRVEHNATLVLREGGKEAKLGLGDVLEDLRSRAEAREIGELADFVEAVGRLVDADSSDADQETRFQDEELQATWLRIRKAWSTPPPR